MILDAIRIEGRCLVVTTPARDRRLAGGVALACGVFLLTTGSGPAAIAALAFIAGGAALVLHRGLTIAFDTERRIISIRAAWLGGGIPIDTLPFAAVASIGLRQETNGTDGAPPRYLPELRLADGRILWLLPSSASRAECDILIETITQATALARHDDPTPSPFSHVA